MTPVDKPNPPAQPVMEALVAGIEDTATGDDETTDAALSYELVRDLEPINMLLSQPQLDGPLVRIETLFGDKTSSLEKVDGEVLQDVLLERAGDDFLIALSSISSLFAMRRDGKETAASMCFEEAARNAATAIDTLHFLLEFISERLCKEPRSQLGKAILPEIYRKDDQGKISHMYDGDSVEFIDDLVEYYRHRVRTEQGGFDRLLAVAAPATLDEEELGLLQLPENQETPEDWSASGVQVPGSAAPSQSPPPGQLDDPIAVLGASPAYVGQGAPKPRPDETD